MQQDTFSIEDAIRFQVRDFIQQVLEEELEEAIGCRYNREGKGYRNGHRSRELTTTMGTVEVDVPRARLRSEVGSFVEFQNSFLPAGRKLTPKAEALITQAYLCGCSVRKVSYALAQALGGSVSRSMVSRCLRRLKPEWDAWQGRDLSGDMIIRLVLDALCLDVRMDGTSHKLCILVALGVTKTGEKVVLSIKDMGGESKEAWLEVLRDLEARGVKEPQICIVDGNPGIEAALGQLWPNCLIQRCTVHKERNLLGYAPPAMHEELKADYQEMMYAPDGQTALRLRKEFIFKWHSKCPKVVKSLKEAGDRLFTFLRFPPQQWRSLRTTNSIERLNEEFRRRVKVQGATHTGDSVCLLFWAMLASGIITHRRVLGFETLNQPIQEELRLAA